jgi:hypothetical protein
LSSLQTIASVKSMAVSGIEEASRLDDSVTRSNNPPLIKRATLAGFNTNLRHCTPQVLAG